MLHASHRAVGAALSQLQTSLDPFKTLVRALVRRPGDYEPMGCLCIYVFMCLYMCLYVTLIVLLCL